MPVSFYMLQNLLIRSLAVNPLRYLFPTSTADNTFRGPEFYEPDFPSATTQVQIFSSVNGIDLETDGYLKPNYQDNNRSPTSSIDLENYDDNLFKDKTTNQQTGSTSATSKRNCHIIKCPQISQPTFGSDGKNCFEFMNTCFLAIANCMRYNNRLSRLQEVKGKQCQNIES
ncbi:uncharacterized protein LOC117792248 [Drosophila innubila]|uniref:uncharacterized protein LOC117792248 n=1 Tax=Drosophila innubila TaxID=198719 RepID=UPI00148CEBA9|nr:uncharacterized protein LOC117792248 [Drosophila innubila]